MERKALILTGASRGIGFAKVRRFHAEDWWVVTCSRAPVPEDCSWEGKENHVQLDLSDPADTINSVGILARGLKDELAAAHG